MASRTIEVILKADVENLGNKYDIVRVRPGYAWNYLIPRGFAEVATPGARHHLEAHLRQIAHKLAQEKAAAQQLAQQLQGLTLTIAALAGKEGKLFGAITPQQIVDLLAERGIKIERRQVHFPVPARSLGTYEVEIRLHREVKATLTIAVVPQEEGEE
jgi:large subunit ribosomal protein L9